MPARWLLQYSGLSPSEVELTHLHAVISGYFDDGAAGHPHDDGSAIPHRQSRRKPYAVSAPFEVGDGFGVEIGTMTVKAATRLMERCRPGAARFGRRHAVAAHPQPLAHLEWDDLADHSGETAWRVDFHTPASFTAGQHTSPLPTPSALLRGPALCWAEYGPPGAAPQPQAQAIRLSDIDGRSDVLRIGRKTYSGFVGAARYECDEPEHAASTGQLLRLAEFCGVGAGTPRGLGVVRVTPSSRRH